MFDFHNLDFASRVSTIQYGLFISFLLLVYFICLFKKQPLSHQKPPSWIITIIIIILITFAIGPDKYGYYTKYKEIASGSADINWQNAKDPGWLFLTFIISKFCINEVGYFAIIASFYTLANRHFCSKQSQSGSYLFIAVISFMGFFAYGTNTLRAGTALAILLIAMNNLERSKYLYIVIAIIASLIHKSVAIPATAFFIASHVEKTKIYIILWIGCLLATLATNGALKEYVIQYIGEEDFRIGKYLSGNMSSQYKVGIRWDFIAYSFFPIFIGLYNIIIRKFKDSNYLKLFNTYVITNSFWLIVIAVPFTDRFAYLSWFLYPYVLLIPYLNDFSSHPKIKKAIFLTICIGGFNIYMSLR